MGSLTLAAVILSLWNLRGAANHQVGEAPQMDGILRATADGRSEAYMKPPFPSNHASNLEILANHDILLAWFSGSKEGHSGVAIVMNRLHHGARQFTPADVMSKRDGYSNQNPVIFRDITTNFTYLFHSQQEANKGESNAQIWALQSNDSLAQIWSQPKPLFTKAGSFDRNRVVVSLNNTWLLPIYYSLSGKEQTSAVKECLHRQLFEDDWTEHAIPDSSYLEQPSIVRPKPDEPKLIAFFRDRHAEHIYRAESPDDGETWTKPSKTTLPNNNSGIQASVLKSGNLVLVYNPTHHARNPLVISLSEDGGLTWPHTRTLQESDNEHDEFSYPSVAQAPDGQIHVSHTYLRLTIVKYHIIPSEEWIKNTTLH